MIGCSAQPTGTHSPTASAETFAGTWRSVTPSFEFVGLSVASLSSEQGAFGARLTFSGVEWQGTGRIDGDSLVAALTMGAPPATGTFVAKSLGARSLRVRFQPAAAPLVLTFVREN
jgi:hypothetical protein